MDLDNVGAEQDYRFPRKNMLPAPDVGERLRVFFAFTVCAPVAAYLLVANVILRLP